LAICCWMYFRTIIAATGPSPCLPFWSETDVRLRGGVLSEMIQKYLLEPETASAEVNECAQLISCSLEFISHRTDRYYLCA
jgi:hypothetical protein